MTLRVAIAGGGLAGLACAKDLAERGFAVSLIEALPYLGGRASTFRDDDGDWVEQGLHIFLGVYAELRGLLRDVGQDPDDVLFWTDGIHVHDPLGPSASYGVSLYAPLRTALSLLGQNRFLGPLDKLSLLPLVAPGLAPLERLRRHYDGMTVVDWWRQVRGTDDVLERFVRPFCRGIQFTDADDFSAYDFLGWVHHVAYGILRHRLGGYRGARDLTMFRPIARHLASRGVSIRTGVRLREVGYDARAERVTGFGLEGGERMLADAYVLALPAWLLPPLLPTALRARPGFTALGALPTAPAISVQLWLDRRVLPNGEYHLVARSSSPVFQDQADETYPSALYGSRLSFIVSPADGLLDRDDASLVTEVTAGLRAVLPAARAAAVRKSVVLRHPQHLVRPLPGAMSSRPGQATSVPNLFLAGDWTQQPFFGSQEGAVRGGRACAAALLAAARSGTLRAPPEAAAPARGPRRGAARAAPRRAAARSRG